MLMLMMMKKRKIMIMMINKKKNVCFYDLSKCFGPNINGKKGKELQKEILFAHLLIHFMKLNVLKERKRTKQI